MVTCPETVMATRAAAAAAGGALEPPAPPRLQQFLNDGVLSVPAWDAGGPSLEQSDLAGIADIVAPLVEVNLNRSLGVRPGMALAARDTRHVALLTALGAGIMAQRRAAAELLRAADGGGEAPLLTIKVSENGLRWVCVCVCVWRVGARGRTALPATRAGACGVCVCVCGSGCGRIASRRACARAAQVPSAICVCDQ